MSYIKQASGQESTQRSFDAALIYLITFLLICKVNKKRSK